MVSWVLDGRLDPCETCWWWTSAAGRGCSDLVNFEPGYAARAHMRLPPPTPCHSGRLVAVFPMQCRLPNAGLAILETFRVRLMGFDLRPGPSVHAAPVHVEAVSAVWSSGIVCMPYKRCQLLAQTNMSFKRLVKTYCLLRVRNRPNVIISRSWESKALIPQEKWTQSDDWACAFAGLVRRCAVWCEPRSDAIEYASARLPSGWNAFNAS